MISTPVARPRAMMIRVMRARVVTVRFGRLWWSRYPTEELYRSPPLAFCWKTDTPSWDSPL